MSGRPFTSIKTKLLVSSIAIMGAALFGLVAAVIWINASLSHRHAERTVANIREALIAKGSILVSNNSQALQEMVADNAFLAVSKLVSSTVRDDSDVVFGIYMDKNRRPWVLSVPENPEGQVPAPVPLNDSASLWAAGLGKPGYRPLKIGSGEVYEFAAPVLVEGEAVGVIRYGLTTAGMNAAIAEASQSSRVALLRTIAALLSLGSLAMILSFLGARQQAKTITRPIRELQLAADAISKGEFGRPVSVTSDDEVGLLASDFDKMRGRVKDYTERLEDMVAEKVQEVKDILENIQQGFFTVALDGSVNPDYALSTNAILQVADVSKHNLRQLFRIDKRRLDEWLEWFEVVKEKHGSFRWEKLTRLCPIQALELTDSGGGKRWIQISYQAMFDRKKRLNKLMILAQDLTEARRVERMRKEEKERHEFEVKAILGIVHQAGTIPKFLEDMEARMANLKEALLRLGHGQEADPREGPVSAMLRECHTIKGTAATYGFEALSVAAREAEDILVGMRSQAPLASQDPEALSAVLAGMNDALKAIADLASRLLGGGEALSVPIPESRVKRVRDLCEAVERFQGDIPMKSLLPLLEACRGLDHMRLESLAEKHRTMLERLGERLGKRFEFLTLPASLEMPPRLFSSLDEPLVHMLRNAADHGIESEAERRQAGKPASGRIELIVQPDQGGLSVTVADDGRGIALRSVEEKALTLGAATREEIAAMGEEGKVGLIFLSGLSTRERENDISGRGVGMHAVEAWTKSAGGTISVSSQQGRGTRVTLHLPSAFWPGRGTTLRGEWLGVPRGPELPGGIP